MGILFSNFMLKSSHLCFNHLESDVPSAVVAGSGWPLGFGCFAAVGEGWRRAGV